MAGPAAVRQLIARAAAAAALALLGAGAVPTTACAHAFLERAEPRVGGSVRGAPAEVRLWFTERVEPAYSRVEVLDGQGRPVGSATARVDAGDPKLLRAPLGALAPGRYRVKWRVLSVDSHVTEGDFSFRVE